jgi:hypothetical protein
MAFPSGPARAGGRLRRGREATRFPRAICDTIQMAFALRFCFWSTS